MQRETAQAESATAPTESEGEWRLMLDGVLFATFNRQGGPRGAIEFRSQNWFMAMADRRVGSGTLTLSGMLSLEPVTVGEGGYSEIFQVGEAYRELQITDRQHPHDLAMQLAGWWRRPMGARAGITFGGGLPGEPALGPVAFMHRPSSAENPTAPLSHHVFDSTHIAMGVVTLGADRGPFALEGSLFQGREPDEHRFDLDPGALDSWSARVWYRPGSEWSFQASHGYLHEPEQLEPGSQRRTNASASWFRQRPNGFTAVTAALGRNARPYSTVHAFLLEATHQAGRNAVYGRFEALTVETEILLFPQVVHVPHPGELVDPVEAYTVGAVRDILDFGGFKIGVGGDVSFYGVPPLLENTHGAQPVSFHLFVRLRPPARGGRMWNMTMATPPRVGHAGPHRH
jgi:hypothetical protein